jgi:hypothetical protein
MMLHRVASSLNGSRPERKEPRVGEQYLYVSVCTQARKHSVIVSTSGGEPIDVTAGSAGEFNAAIKAGAEARIARGWLTAGQQQRTGALKYDAFLPRERVYERSLVIRIVEEGVVAQIVDEQEHHCAGESKLPRTFSCGTSRSMNGGACGPGLGSDTAGSSVQCGLVAGAGPAAAATLTAAQPSSNARNSIVLRRRKRRRRSWPTAAGPPG